MRFCARLFVLTVALNGAIQADEAKVAADSSPMAIMAPGGPVLAQIRISVDGEAYRLWVTRFLAAKTDVDGNDRLTLEELKLIPERLLQQAEIKNAGQLLRLSAGTPGVDDVSVDAFTKWFTQRLSRSFSVIAEAVQASEAVRLAALVDQNGDGSVDRDELLNGKHSLRFRDLDNDETFTAAELLPYRDPRNQQAAVVPDAADLPFVQLGDDESIDRTARQILTRYGDGESVNAECFRLSDTVWQATNVGADGKLNHDQIQQLLRSGVYHLIVNIQLSDRPNASRLNCEVSDAASSFCRLSDAERRGRMKLVIDDMPIELRARGGSSNMRTFLTGFILQRFSLNDSDKSGYLSEDEYPAMQQQLAQQSIVASFQQADLNNDEMLFRDELKMFIERDAIATQSRIEVSLRQDGTTLFKLLDANSDRRLSYRELLEGFEVLLPYDHNNDQKFSEAELGTAYALEIGLGQAASLRMDTMMQGMNMQARSTDAILPGVAGLEGPEWFRRMDRNQDRDVSRREFLGPRDIFDQLDGNNDGLLSAAEAEMLQ